MTCPDVKDLLFDEYLNDDLKGDLKNNPMRSAVVAHVSTCEACALELERLRATTAALGLVQDQEPLVRIRFVSDRVFEQPWWQRLLGRGALWANAGFAILSCVAAGLIWFQTAGSGASLRAGHLGVGPAAGQPVAMAPADVNRLVDARVQQAVLEARAESDQRHAAEMKTMLTAFEREQAQQQQQLFQRIEAAWRIEDGLKTRALYAVLEKPVAGQSGQ
jgi:hypothetical protein